MGSVSVGTVFHFCVSTCGAKVWIFVCVHEGGNICLCICVLVVYVYVSGRALDSASLIILVDPTPPPCSAGGGCRRCVGDFSRRGRMLGRAPAHSRRSIGGAWPYWPCWAPIGGVGGLWVSGPRARSALVWSAAGGACGLAATALHCGCRRSRLRALLCPFWVEAAVVPAVVLLGVPCPGGPPDVWGPGLFRACFMPCGMGLLFPTHTIKRLHGGTLWTQARSHTQVYTQAFTLV